jgi:hypothetical protein
MGPTLSLSAHARKATGVSTARIVIFISREIIYTGKRGLGHSFKFTI